MNDLVRRELVANILGHSIYDDNDYREASRLLYALPVIQESKIGHCKDCKKWEDCPCGKDGHESGTSQGYSIGECKDFEPQERSGKE